MPVSVSIVMVSYHTGPVLFEAMEAVLADRAVTQLCLVDNGNDAATIERLKGYAGDTRVHLITGHGNIGFGAGCNLGARAATSEMLLLLNPDSLLPPGAIERLLGEAAPLKAPFLLGARLLDGEGRDQRGCRRALLTPFTAVTEGLHLGFLFPKYRLNFNEDLVPASTVTMPAISGAFMFLRRSDYWAIGGYDEGYFLHVEDLDFCLRFRRAGGEIYFTPHVVVTHIGGTSRAPKAFIEKHKARGFIRYFHKNFGGEAPLALLWLLDLMIWARTWLKILAS